MIFSLLTAIIAQGTTVHPDIGEVTWPVHNPDITGVESFLQLAIDWFFGIAGALAVIAFLYSGILYITAAGDITKKDGGANQAAKAKKNLGWAITGIVVLLLSYIIIEWVANILNTGRTQ